MMIRKIYSCLYDKFGDLHWWPTISKNKQFEIILGCILTQNTSWKNVEKAIFNLNKNNLISVDKIHKINLIKLAKLIRSAGYYNQKAKKLKIFVNYLIKNYSGDLKKLFRKNNLREELLSINGIGPETADSIILYAAKKPTFVIDAYTKRIFSRLGFCKDDVSYDDLQYLFMKNLPEDVKMFNKYHALIVEHGKQTCRKKPICEKCSIRKFCKFQ